MPQLNGDYISDLQSRTFSQKIENSKNVVDLWYEGYDINNPQISFEQYGKYAHVNRALFWLSSKPWDYIRESNNGGILYSLIGRLTNDTNLTDWENEIRDRFNDNFAADLQAMYVKLTLDKNKRILYISMIARDMLTNEMYPLATEASLD